MLALALLAPEEGVAQEVKQIKLTDKHIQGFIAAHEAMSKLYEGIDAGNSDPKIEKQAAAIVKKNGFANLEEHDVVSMNISMIMCGIDPQTKKFLEPPDQIKHDIALLKADKSVPEARKKEDLAQLESALKTSKPIAFKENIALVLKYYDKLPPLFQEQGPALARAAQVHCPGITRLKGKQYGWHASISGHSQSICRAFIEKAWRRLVDMIGTLQKDMQR